MTVVVSSTAPETFDAAGCTFRILDGGSPTDGRIGVAELTLPPGWGGPPQHVHREHDETFYVLTGAVRFTSGSEQFVAQPGQLVTAPIGDAHTFANPDADTGATLLCTVNPNQYLNYFRELADLTPGPDGRLNPADIMAVMQRYATEPVRG